MNCYSFYYSICSESRNEVSRLPKPKWSRDCWLVEMMNDIAIADHFYLSAIFERCLSLKDEMFRLKPGFWWKFNQIDCRERTEIGIMSPVINAMKIYREFHRKWHFYLHIKTADIISSFIFFVFSSSLLVFFRAQFAFLTASLCSRPVLRLLLSPPYAISLHHTPS